MINVAFWGLPVTFACPYDEAALPDTIIGCAESTHPLILRSGGSSDSSEYARPELFVEKLNAQTPVRAAVPRIRMPFDLGNPTRSEAWSKAGGRGGAAGDRLLDHTLAVDEVATNAILHGASPARLKLWREPGELIWEVSDTGPGIRDPLAGQIAPDPAALGGRGLWMARMISDSLKFRSDGDGTVVALHFALSSTERRERDGGAGRRSTRGNVTEVKVVLASVVASLACYQVLLMAVGYREAEAPLSRRRRRVCRASRDR